MLISKARRRLRRKSLVLTAIRRTARSWREQMLGWRRLRISYGLLGTSTSTSRVHAGLCAGLGAILIWLIISSFLAHQSYTARLSNINSDAIELASTQASRQVAPRSPGTSRDFDLPSQIRTALADRLRSNAEGLLSRYPLNALALRALGQLADEAGYEIQAEKLMEAAVQRSLLESTAVYWIMRKNYERGNFAMTSYYADALLRTRPQFVAQVTPILARMAENKLGNEELKKLVGSNPPWRSQFFSELPKSISDPRTPLYLFLALRDTPTPPTASDRRSYLHFLIQHKSYEVAYYTWLQFLTPEELAKAGFLFNGDFETLPAGLPFDWVISRGSGVTIDIVARPDEPANRALYVEFGYGRVEFNGVSQFTLLAPGTYRFAGRFKGELIGRRGLVWRITCANGPAIGQSAAVLGSALTWKNFDFVFTVPERDCRAQSVQLVLDARSASEQFISGSMWYDDLTVSRVEKS